MGEYDPEGLYELYNWVVREAKGVLIFIPKMSILSSTCFNNFGL